MKEKIQNFIKLFEEYRKITYDVEGLLDRMLEADSIKTLEEKKEADILENNK